jgi:uncharacterized cupredoxin-like copper-binding protein
MKRRAIVALLALAAALPAGCGGGGGSDRALEVRMHYSHYQPGTLVVKAGTTVSFELVNTDPIEHEFIIGTAAQQLAHERGNPNDPHTGPGEALLAGGAHTHISFTFARPGTLQYACHRPGHYAFGMVGTIRVTAQAESPARSCRRARR